MPPPATLQCLMNYVFASFTRKFVLVFMDDILIYSRTIEDHVQHLRQVFQVLLAHKLYIMFSKYAFAQPQIEYLGHIIPHKGMTTNPTKIDVMVNWHVPTSLTDVRGFLDITRYYRKFIRDYGIITKPLT
jgi:hypothetical protein